MNIDEIILSLDKSPGHSISIPGNWAQGRTVYGGLTAALIYHRMQKVVAEDQPVEHRPIRYLNLSFIGPLVVKEALSIMVELVRAGRSATQLIAHVKQNGKTAVIAQACFGIDRISKLEKIDHYHHTMTIPKKADFIPQIPKIVPKFLRHVELDLQAGRYPFMQGKKDYLHGWMRFKQPPQKYTDAHLIALIDAWPCTVLQQLKLPAPASTMNWSLEFTQTGSSPKTNQWLAYQSKTEHAANGYVFGDAHIWNQQGELLALSRQTVGVFG